ncbi:MAG TPA: homoserine dehydrogenase [Tepidisphaeraceae bacterium]|nr:homoserine dehydrogenase [Tepidisphaeraceae bacterium]
MTKPIGIALLGCGIVGSGVLKLLDEQRTMLRARTGLEFEVRHVVVRNPERYRTQAGSLNLHTDAAGAIDDPAVQIVVELIGGTTDAAAHIERALKLGKPVVTANKSLLAARGPELFRLARQHDAAIAFEASCGGGVPIIDALQKGLLANRIDALVGIVNGTCNFILTQMTRHNMSYADALAAAQQAGFAEADPTLDVTGRDAAQKLTLLASLAFNALVREQDIAVEGIDTLSPADIGYARELGYVIKLLAIAQRERGEQLSLRVHPTLVHAHDVLADVSGSFNAISIWGHALGHALFYGRGAGQMPTASAVVSDLLGVALGTVTIAFRGLRIFPDSLEPADVLPFEQLESRYYLRLSARDVPGVLAEITEALGRASISLSAILQRESEDGSPFVPVVITTHRAREGAIRDALRAIDALPTIQPPTVCLRIIDAPREFAER